MDLRSVIMFAQWLLWQKPPNSGAAWNDATTARPCSRGPAFNSGRHHQAECSPDRTCARQTAVTARPTESRSLQYASEPRYLLTRGPREICDHRAAPSFGSAVKWV